MSPSLKFLGRIPVENLSAAMTLVSLDSPDRVKLRRTQCEQMFSGLPLKADIAQCSRHVSKVPASDSCTAAKAGSGAHSGKPRRAIVSSTIARCFELRV